MATTQTTNSRDEAIAQIRQALQKRSGKAWSVTGGRGTAWGWIRVDAPPRRRSFAFDGVSAGQHMSLADRTELGQLLGLDGPVHPQGVSIAASSAYYREYVERAQGLKPSVIAQPYWD